MDLNDERDTAEEQYNANLCPLCDSSPCFGGAGKGSCDDPDNTAALRQRHAELRAMGLPGLRGIVACKCGKRIHRGLAGRGAIAPNGSTVVLDGRTCRVCLETAGYVPAGGVQTS